KVCQGNRSEQQRPRDVAEDEDRAPAQAVDPDPGRQAHEQEREELDRRQRGDLERAHVQHVDRDERQRQLRELRPELADCLRRPELDEVRMAPEASGRPEPHACSVSSALCLCAGARSMRTSPETVFAYTSTSGLLSSAGGASCGASASSNSELVEPLTV